MSVLRWVLGFFEERKPQSMARLLAFLCAVAGCVVAIIAAIRKDQQALTVSALIGGGAVAILSRTKNPPASGGDGSASTPKSGEIG